MRAASKFIPFFSFLYRLQIRLGSIGCSVATLLLLVGLASPVKGVDESSSIVSQVEIALLYKILTFIDLASYEQDGTMNVCAAEGTPAEIEFLAERLIKNRRVTVTMIKGGENPSTLCDVLVTSNLEDLDKIPATLSVYRGKLDCESPVVPHVGIYIRSGKFAFDVNLKRSKTEGMVVNLGLTKRAIQVCEASD